MTTYLREEAALKFPFNSPAGYDHKAWAKRILWRLEMRDAELLPIQIRFAQEAMDIKPEATTQRASA
jgi:hypothetical protein